MCPPLCFRDVDLKSGMCNLIFLGWCIRPDARRGMYAPSRHIHQLAERRLAQIEDLRFRSAASKWQSFAMRQPGRLAG